MTTVPKYLIDSINNLNQQWNRIVDVYIDSIHSVRYKSRKDTVSLAGLRREGTISVGGRSYNPTTVINLLHTLSQRSDSTAPPVGETGVSRDDFIRSTIEPIAASNPEDEDPLHIKLYIDDNQNIRLLHQAELNWFFTGTWDQYNQIPARGLRDPMTNSPLSISDLNNIYNLFFKSNQTRSGLTYGLSAGGVRVKRKKANRANRTHAKRRRLSTKRTTRRTRHTRSRRR
jgi:hypothetical protein